MAANWTNYPPASPKELAANERPEILHLIKTDGVVAACFQAAETYEQFMELAVLNLARLYKAKTDKEIERVMSLPLSAFEGVPIPIHVTALGVMRDILG